MYGVVLQNIKGHPEIQNLYDFLRNNIKFSKSEFNRMKHGEIVTKLLDSKLRREVVFFGLMRVNVPRQFFINEYHHRGIFIETIDAIDSGQFSNPPVLEDVKNLTLDPDDIKAIKNCKVGHCDIKMSAQSMEEFRKSIGALLTTRSR